MFWPFRPRRVLVADDKKETPKMVRRNSLAASKQLASDKMDRVGKMIKDNGGNLRRRASVMLKDMVKEKKIIRKAIGSGAKKERGKKAGEVCAERSSKGPFVLEDTSKTPVDYGVFAQIRDLEDLGDRIREMIEQS